MTKEEFYNLAKKRAEIIDESVYKLTVRYYREKKGIYNQTHGKEEWFYKLCRLSRIYTTKDRAEKAMKQFLTCSKRNHSALIERLALDGPIGMGSLLEWWLYDKDGEMIDYSVCSYRFEDNPSIQDIYMGRTPEMIRFKPGDIVEVINDCRVHLEVLNGVPPTIEEMWQKYDSAVKKIGMPRTGDYSPEYFSDYMAESYFYLSQSGFDPDVPSYMVMKPTFPVPEKAKEILTTRFNTWQSYMDSHSHEEINWEELYALIREKSNK